MYSCFVGLLFVLRQMIEFTHPFGHLFPGYKKTLEIEFSRKKSWV